MELAGRRRMLLALIMATVTLGLLFSGWFTPTPGLAQQGTGNPQPNIETINCDKPSTNIECVSAAQLVFSNIIMSPSAPNGAPYNSIVSVCDTIGAALVTQIIPATNRSHICHTCNGSTPTNWCEGWSYNRVKPEKITNTWSLLGGWALTNGWRTYGPTSGTNNSVAFTCTNATGGTVSFNNLSVKMPTNGNVCGVTSPGPISRSYAFVAVSTLTPDLSWVTSAVAGPNAWYVCAVTNAAITVTATSAPGLPEEYLPGSWITTGGIGTNKLWRNVDISHAGTNAVSCIAGCSGKTNKIIVVKADIAETGIAASVCDIVTVHLTGDSSTNTVWTLSPTNAGGATIVSNTGTILTLYAGTNCGSYTITSATVELGGAVCGDSATLTVYRVVDLSPDRGTLVTNAPPTWVVCAVPTNAVETNLVVTASPCPGVSNDTNLPSSWKMTGGLPLTNWDGNLSRTRRAVDMTTPGTNLIVATAGCSTLTNVIIVTAPIKLNIEGYADTNKFDPGVILFANNDDDNTNAVPDLAETNAVVVNEDDLLALTFTKNSAPLGDTNTLTVSTSGYGGNVKIWRSPQRGPDGPVIDTANGTNSFTFLDTAMPALYIEGISSSSYDNDVTLTVSSDFVPCSPDQARITVINAIVAVDMNRDGGIDFGDGDATTAKNPYCFWLNNNHDGYGKIWNANLSYTWVQEDLDSGDDSTSSSIGCTRDLEDYTRLAIQIQGLSQHRLTNGEVTVKLESGGPQIRIFPAVAGDATTYLTDRDTAQEQIAKASLGVAGTYEFSANTWKDSTTVYLLFDGIGGGNGKLKPCLYARDHSKLGEGQPAYVNLKDIKSMYETWSVSGTPPATTATSGSFQYSSASPETGQYVLFLHGWNMSETAKDQFANTAYKRLWWQNYKGRFGAFRWPTLTGMTTFDASEFIAWQSASALANKLNDLNAEYTNSVYLFAHSMGNVVAGEAFKLTGPSQAVNSYVACQAAISAHAYDPSTTGWESTSSTPDSLAYYPTPSDPCYFNGVTSAVSRANFYNQNDWALKWWTTDQALKPNAIDFPGHHYSSSSGFYRIAGQNVTYLHFPDDRYEIFAYCVQSPCYALGATPEVANFGDMVDLEGLWGEDPFGDMHKDHCWHSGQFLFSTVEQWNWWAALMTSFKLQQTQ